MTNNKHSHDEQDLALHVGRLRLWYGDRKLSQGALAELAGISDRHLRRYERATILPPPVLTVLRLAIALHVSVEALIDQGLLDELRADIEARRVERGLTLPGDDYVP
jgi:transcriptional regulator with XRE-family HTH domain